MKRTMVVYAYFGVLSVLFPVKGASMLRLHGSKLPVADTGQHPWLCPGFTIRYLPPLLLPVESTVSGIR